ncbi:SAM-dependent methyltransferase, MidA family [Nitrosomonas eutropha]|uniref:class I SAM-dependent methyltransferase n=1 Tax=Nitrosomonas TaxID=914 RepID=UPI000898B9DC|nr:SAM-dependent methyltransferase [Nitrosomonas eutropha]MXS80249.1 class I SAM-dependent methyltransferase [Nitrosomonas sp. GH22]SDW33297.1 SAM-dependent methyltransferase, MidA family [Nitrosomonas eutropha]
MTLPLPNSSEQKYSDILKTILRDRISLSGGWISFADYMDVVLYTPEAGYYSGGAAKFGAAGDFVTSPEISPLFGQILARQVAQVLRSVNHGSILEFGAGSGRLAVDLLLALEALESLPECYNILDLSADLQQRQQAIIKQRIPHLAARVQWLTTLPDQFKGLIFANEVLDAMPVHLVVWKNGNIAERGVIWKDYELAWQDQLLTEGELLNVARQLPPSDQPSFPHPYISEISLANRHFIHSLASILQQGAILLVDYGFGQSEYYHPQRHQGTLMCHYRHHAHDDPLFLPGLQDITSHVDFSAISRIALDSGLQLAGYTTQAHFLINCGITDLLARTPADQPGIYLPLVSQVQCLISPAEMGEMFKVMILNKAINIDTTSCGFMRGDLRHLL